MWVFAGLPELGHPEKEHKIMSSPTKLIWKLQIRRDTNGQELIEYALVAGFLACACGAALPDIGSSVITVLSKVVSVLSPLTDDGSGSSMSN
jgi:pilus assembly protein Flp/PilA